MVGSFALKVDSIAIRYCMALVDVIWKVPLATLLDSKLGNLKFYDAFASVSGCI